MTTTIRDIMTSNVVTLESDATAADAAKKMRDSAVGDVLVMEHGRLFGLVTDRDIVVRCVADDRDPKQVRLADVCSKDVVTLPSSSKVTDAVAAMREETVRRIPVMDDGNVVGIVALGDLAVERDRRSALGGISAAPPDQ